MMQTPAQDAVRSPRDIKQLLVSGALSAALGAMIQRIRAGHLDWELLEQVWATAVAEERLDFLDEALEQITTRHPTLIDWRLSLLRAGRCHARRQWAERIEALRAARAQGCPRRDLTVLEAAAHERLLQPGKALELLDQSPDLEGDIHHHAQLVRLRCLEQLGCRAEAVALAQDWLPIAGDSEAAVSGYKSLARVLDKLGQYQEAWDAAERGNRLAMSRYPHAIGDNSTRWRIEIWQALFRPGSAFTLPRYDCDQAAPVFLVGFPRSGTTLIEQVLDAHPRIQAVEEPPSITRALEHAFELARARAWIKGGGRLRGRNKREVLLGVFSEMANFSEKEVAEVRRTYFSVIDQRISRREDALLLDKMPLSSIDIGFIKMLFPAARFVLMLRHPVDVLISCLFQSFEANDAMVNFHSSDSAVSFHRRVMALVSTYRQAGVVQAGDLFELRYEQLVGDFDRQVDALMAFIGVERDAGQSLFYEHARQRGSLATPSHGGVSQPVYSAAVGRWRGYRDVLLPLLDDLEVACRELGYTLDV